MVTSSYIVVVRTGENTPPEDYNDKCEAMQELLKSVIQSNIADLTKRAALNELTLNVEVQLDYNKDCVDLPPYSCDDDLWELTGRAILECSSEAKVPLDKSKLSRLLKEHPSNKWGGQLKVEKRALPADWDSGAGVCTPIPK